MATKKKMPKRPKINASLDVWKRWEERAKVVKAHNTKIDQVKKQKESISKKYK
jgi:hypothetical protein